MSLSIEKLSVRLINAKLIPSWLGAAARLSMKNNILF